MEKKPILLRTVLDVEKFVFHGNKCFDCIRTSKPLVNEDIYVAPLVNVGKSPPVLSSLNAIPG